MDYGKIAIGDVLLIPLIIGLVQVIKRFLPQAPENLFFGLSFLFALALQTVVFLIGHGASFAGWDLETWALCMVTGLAFGLAASKAYDELSVRGPKPVKALLGRLGHER